MTNYLPAMIEDLKSALDQSRQVLNGSPRDWTPKTNYGKLLKLYLERKDLNRPPQRVDQMVIANRNARRGLKMVDTQVWWMQHMKRRYEP